MFLMFYRRSNINRNGIVSTRKKHVENAVATGNGVYYKYGSQSARVVCCFCPKRKPRLWSSETSQLFSTKLFSSYFDDLLAPSTMGQMTLDWADDTSPTTLSCRSVVCTTLNCLNHKMFTY